MPRDFFPRRDADALSFTGNFSRRIVADPGMYHLTDAQAANYAALQEAFAQAYQVAVSPGSNSIFSTQLKKSARRALEAETRRLGHYIRAWREITLSQMIELGLKVRSQPTRINPPESAPWLYVRSVDGRTVHVELFDAGSGKRKMPKGVNGATIFSYIGGELPRKMGDWKLAGMTGNTKHEVMFPSTLPPGAKVWLCAFWMNPRQEHGPYCAAVSAHLGYGVALRTALKAA